MVQRTKKQRRDKPSHEAAVHIDSGEPSRERLHGDNTANDALIIAEQQTTESGKLPTLTTDQLPPIVIRTEATPHR